MPVRISECNVPGCTERQYKGGICRTHIAENYVLSCCEKDARGHDCEREVFAKERCRAHYMRRYRTKEGRPASAAPIRSYGQQRRDVFTRLPEEDVEVIVRAAGRERGLYSKAAEILSAWAKRTRARETSTAHH